MYLLANQISSEILNKQFQFYVNIQGDDGYKDDLIEDILSTPSEFDLIEFLNYAMRNNSDKASLNYNKI